MIARSGLDSNTIADATPHASRERIAAIRREAQTFSRDYTRCGAENRDALGTLDKALATAQSFDILCDSCAALSTAARATHLAPTNTRELRGFCDTCWTLSGRSDD
jgi:hypothetical protein